MNRRSNPNRSLISCFGRVQFSDEKLNSVRWAMPSSSAASTVRLTLSTPRRWPSTRGRPRSAAQRPLPSMMMAMWRAAGFPAACQSTSSAASVTFGCSGLRGTPCEGPVWLNLHDLGFLAGKGLVDFLDDLVGQFLHLGRKRVVLVLAHLVLFLRALQVLHAVAAHIAHRHPRLLGVFVRDLGDFLPSLLVQLRNGKPQQLALDHGVEPQIRLSDRTLHRADLAAVPDLHGDEAGLGHVDGGELIERHRVAVGGHGNGVENACAGAAGAQAAELLLEDAEGPAHAALDLLEVETGHLASLPLARHLPIGLACLPMF